MTDPDSFDGGFIQQDRAVYDTSVFSWANHPATMLFYLYLLQKAAWRDTNWKGIPILRGQAVTGLHAMSKDTGLSIQEIRTCLQRLISSEEITVKSTNKYSVITIRRYDRFIRSQSLGQQTINKQSTNHGLFAT